MATEVSMVQYCVAHIPHKAGQGAALLAAVKEAGFNMSAFLGYKKSAKVAEIIIAWMGSGAVLKKLLKKQNVAVASEGKGFLATGDDVPGAVGELLACLAGAGINVETIHAVAAGAGRFGALLTVAAADAAKAKKALGAK